ncbi:PEGA domain-containing protein [Patescibacteria group bacterium]|nr:PEGA domain-containing protein [Patescibacteria group bacterium]MBU1966750.1 PEGA domain-containing protein [Patescibacteria group bacterium]MBU2543539.1 PEGA domain-containing protein [Patescibacteria group bacterium]
MRFTTIFKRINTRVLYTVLSAFVILAGTIMAIQYAKGNYRFTQDGFVKESGLLSANSFPNGAQVLINDKLVTATDDTLYLEPDTYRVKIIKDGYAPWEKTLSIEKELVVQTNALLFPSAPSLTPLSFTGAENISPSPDGQKIIYYTQTASADAQNGLYIIEMGNLLPLQKSAKQIAEDVPSWNLAQAEFIWAPDSNQVMVIANGHHILLATDKKQNIRALADVSIKRKQIFSQWEEEMYLRERQFLAKFPTEIIQYATASARNVYLSPDKKKLIYTAPKQYVLPNDIIPHVPATNTQPEERELQPNGIYIYDSEEDKNFRIGTEPDPTDQAQFPHKYLLTTDLGSPIDSNLKASPSAFMKLQATSSAVTATNFRTYYAPYTNSYQWFPDSRHVIHSWADTIKIMEYDGTNDITIYSGPFAENFTYPWPDGSKLIILTSFSPNSPLNLYAVELRR